MYFHTFIPIAYIPGTRSKIPIKMYIYLKCYELLIFLEVEDKQLLLFVTLSSHTKLADIVIYDSKMKKFFLLTYSFWSHLHRKVSKRE